MALGKACWCDPVHGRSYMPTIAKWTGICSYNALDVISIIAGLLNIFFWIILSIPQYRKLIASKSSKGISIAMLALWTIADVAGLAGLLVSSSGGDPTLLWLTIFFTVNNCIACGIWFYYDRIYPKLHKKTNEDGYTLMEDDDEHKVGLLSGDVYDGSQPRNKMDLSSLDSRSNPNDQLEPTSMAALSDQDLLDVPIVLTSLNSLNSAGGGGGANEDLIPIVPRRGGRLFDASFMPFVVAMVLAVTCLQVVDARRVLDGAIDGIYSNVQSLVANNPEKLPYCVEDTLPSTTKRIIGFIMTAICAVMNSVSRIPQVKLNATRKTTAGLSLTFTLYQLCANFFFFISRFTPTTLEFSMHWFETSFPWAVSTGISTICLLAIWYQVYWYGNGASIRGNQFKTYSRGIVDSVIFCLPRRKAGQTDYYDELEEAQRAMETEGELAPSSSSISRSRSSARVGLDSLSSDAPSKPSKSGGSDDLTKVSSISFYRDEDDEATTADQFDDVTQADIDAVVNSNFGNPMFNMSFEAELHNPVMRASSSFVRTLSNLGARK